MKIRCEIPYHVANLDGFASGTLLDDIEVFKLAYKEATEAGYSDIRLDCHDGYYYLYGSREETEKEKKKRERRELEEARRQEEAKARKIKLAKEVMAQFPEEFNNKRISKT